MELLTEGRVCDTARVRCRKPNKQKHRRDCGKMTFWLINECCCCKKCEDTNWTKWTLQTFLWVCQAYLSGDNLVCNYTTAIKTYTPDFTDSSYLCFTATSNIHCQTEITFLEIIEYLKKAILIINLEIIDKVSLGSQDSIASTLGMIKCSFRTWIHHTNRNQSM
jgi:hypothetical protein